MRSPAPPACACKTARGNPRNHGAQFSLLRDTKFAGHSEMQVQCTQCKTKYEVTEDVGYHVPQYHWR
ncbi:MAG: hypothetical protein WD046_02770 [Paracoccaceae bacterium]